MVIFLNYSFNENVIDVAGNFLMQFKKFPRHKAKTPSFFIVDKKHYVKHWIEYIHTYHHKFIYIVHICIHKLE